MVRAPSPALIGLVAQLDLPRIPRQSRSRQKRDRILAAALATFGERGYAAASIEEIASRAGVAVGTVYGYFRSKRQNLHNLVGSHVEQILALGVGDLDLALPMAAIEEVVRTAVLRDLAFVGMRRACQEALPDDSELAGYVEQAKATIRAQIASAIERARLGGGVRSELDSGATALAVVALIDQLGFLPEAANESVIRAATRMIYHAIFEDS